MIYQVAVLCWAASAVLSAPTDVVPLEKQQPTVIPIVSQSEELEPNGTYKFSYETGNGIKREEISYDKIIPKVRGGGDASSEGGGSDESDEIHVQQGSYSYTAPDGTVITVRYIADENGFQAFGDHLPRAPTVQQIASSPADKSGRALKSDSAETASAPVPAVKPKEIQKPVEPTPEIAQSAADGQPASSEPTSAPAVAAENSIDITSKSGVKDAASPEQASVEATEQNVAAASEPKSEAADQTNAVTEQTTEAAKESTADVEEASGDGEQSSTTTAEQLTSTSEQTTALAEQSTVGAEQTTASAEETTAAADQSTAATADTTVAAEKSTASAEQSTAVAEQSTAAATEEVSSAGTEQSAANAQELTTASGSEEPAVGAEQPSTAADVLSTPASIDSQTSVTSAAEEAPASNSEPEQQLSTESSP